MSGRGHGSVGGEIEAVRIWLLGGFRVVVGSTTIEGTKWRLKKAAALVKLLSLARDHRLHREQVMEVLWPDLGKQAASNNLRHTLHAARRILDPDTGSRYLASQNESLALCPGGQLWVDLDAFEEMAATARRSRDPAAYEAAIDLYAGDLLPDDRYEAWAENRRGALLQLCLALLVELAGLHEERGEYGPAIEALRKATAKEPTFEEAHATLMRFHGLAGRPERAIAQYERLRDVLLDKLGAEPGETTRHLRDEIAAGRLSPAPPAPPVQKEPSDADKHNLPVARTSFVGREREMVEVKSALAMTQLLTLTGAGGSGKTRLALEVARDFVGAYPEGVWLVELAPLSEPELVVQEVAKSLEVPERPGQPLTDTLVETLRPKRTLLVLDNCEHLVDAVARLVDDLLRSCPNLRLLATSREVLGVSGEVNRPVLPLSLPDPERPPTVEELEGCGSARLFVERALYRTSTLVLSPESAGAVAEICRRLDGIPLAIELAAARVGVLAVEQISERLSDSLTLLTGGGRTATARQRTLRGSIDWSHELLSEPERELFRRLSVFAGGWTLETAGAVCSGGSIGPNDVLDLLGGLVDKSLVVTGVNTGGVARYGMLEPIRQYVGEKLEQSSEANVVRGRHAAFFLALAEEAEPELVGPEQSMWVERLEAEHDNLREALAWLLARGDSETGLRFGGALWRLWFAQGYLSEGIRWLEQVLAEGVPAAAPVRVKALEGMGWLSQFQGDFDRAEATYDEMLTLSRELGDRGNIATALNSLGTLAAYRGAHEQTRALLEENLAVLRELEDEGNDAATLKRFHALNLLGLLALNEERDPARATTLWEESLALARETGDTYRVGVSLVSLGYAALLQGSYERATALCEETLVLAQELGSAGVELIPETLINLGLAARSRDEHERAVSSFEESLAVAREAGSKPSLINALEGIAGLSGALEEDVRAARLWGAAEAAREVTGIALPPDERALHEPYLAAARSRLGDATWQGALAEGRAMTLDQAVEYALSKEPGEETDTPAIPVPEKPQAGEPGGELTRREREVTVLVARGLTNRQISTTLSISERTAGNHVARILHKLGLRSRAQIATWATEHQLLAPDTD